MPPTLNHIVLGYRYQRLAKPTGLELESVEGKEEEEEDDVVVYEKD